MALSSGARLGPYEILAAIGAGGMGEVYKARDTRLGRTVAIKVLPAGLAADPERRRRFEQEARAASALSHPNIVTLHGMANDGGVDYLVMEYVPGKSLDRLITPKGLPLAEALDYAHQIASALSAAHTAGIVHRDIKPANVIVTAESQVKVLDFGLAKLAEHAPVSGGEPLTEPALTEAGAVMGSVAYMSPEQASGKALDHRADIFSLGIILYEMLAGRRPFRGTAQVETMHAIIHDPVPPLPAQPPELGEILEKALAKDPKDRYQHAGDLALDLRRFRQKPSGARQAAPVPGQSRWRVNGVVAALLLLAAVATTLLLTRTGEQWVNPLENARFTRLTDFLPDGRSFVVLQGPYRNQNFYLVDVDTGARRQLTDLKPGSLLRNFDISPDGKQIVFDRIQENSDVVLIDLPGKK